MPSTPYDLVSDDLDVRVPLYADQAFDHGITFQAKVNHQPHADALKVSDVVHGIEMMQLLKRKPYNTLHFDVRTFHKEYIIELFCA
uniref:Uncharacterized protein n=1 Tax=Phlebotomus papatasi TaxID=29031 RepID=A0A1B0D5X2_PHLPP